MSRPFTILEHRKSAVDEGRSILRNVAITTVGMSVVEYFLFPVFWANSGWFGGKLIVTSFVVMQVAIVSLFVYTAVVHLRSTDAFVCRLDDKEIVCVCPSVHGPEALQNGESFSLRLLDIAKLEEEPDTEASNRSRWYIWNTSGERFWLTSNYDNPVAKFVEAIQDRIPDIVVVRT